MLDFFLAFLPRSLCFSQPLIKFNLLDFFQLPLEWDVGVNRSSREPTFPLGILQSSMHWSPSKGEKRKSWRANWVGCKLQKQPLLRISAQYLLCVFDSGCLYGCESHLLCLSVWKYKYLLWIAWLCFCVQDKVLCFVFVSCCSALVSWYKTNAFSPTAVN